MFVDCNGWRFLNDKSTTLFHNHMKFGPHGPVYQAHVPQKNLLFLLLDIMIAVVQFN